MRLMSVKQAAEIAGCSKQTILRAINDDDSGFFEGSFKAGNMWVLYPEEVEAFDLWFNRTEFDDEIVEEDND